MRDAWKERIKYVLVRRMGRTGGQNYIEILVEHLVRALFSMTLPQRQLLKFYKETLQTKMSC